VRGGEHGTKVYYFKQLTVEDKEGEEKRIPMLREYTVFNVSQCESLPDRIMNGEYIAPRNQDQREADCDAFIKSTGADFREGSGVPCYVPSKDFISMPPFSAFNSRPAFYATSVP
jgi:antirestriction protein ArdC